MKPRILAIVLSLFMVTASFVFPRGSRLGYIPPPVSLKHIRGALDEAVHMNYPPSFDLRDYDRVSPMKDQDAYPTCWIFAAFASLESCLLPDESVNFSEWHLALNHGFDYELQEAGNSWMTTAYLIRWSGPLEEWIYAYPQQLTSNNVNAGNISNDGFPLAKHVQQVIFLPERTGPLDNDTVKFFLVNHGPVDFAMYWDFDYFDPNFNSQYAPWERGQNHRLAIVGWDDNYPGRNFALTPPGNGAFIARNSWGGGWGEGGYCYISYYDPTLQEFTCFNNAESPTNYDSIYQYDPLGRTGSWGGRDAWGANVFTAVDNQPLQAVGFYTNDANAQYEIYIYKYINPAAGNPRSGLLAASKTGSFIYPGFYTVPLDTPVALEPGEKFSAAVRFINSENRGAVPVEIPILNHSSAAAANPGESYVSIDGIEWNDLTESMTAANVCIKAYSKFPFLPVTLEAERKKLSGWIISREYGNISFAIENLFELPVAGVRLLRKTDGGGYRELLRMLPAEPMDSGYTFVDYDVEQWAYCTYRVVTYDNEGRVSGKSAEVTI
jgi:C1A family cysteine protease